MYNVTDGPSWDDEAEIAMLMFECRLAVEAAVQGAECLKQTPFARVRKAEIDTILKHLEQAAEAFQNLHRTIARLHSFGPQGDSPTASGKDLEEVGEAIRRANMPAGEFIQEADLADHLKKEHRVVREAAIWLENRGVVECVPYAGIRESSFSEADLSDLFEIREALEPIACGVAATVMTREEKNGLSHFLGQEAKRKHKEDQVAIFEDAGPDRRDNFYLQIIRGSKKASIIEVLCDRTHYRLWFYRRFFRQNSNSMPSVTAERKRIIAALLAGDAVLSAAEMRQHLANVRARTVWIGRPERRCNIENLQAHRKLKRRSARRYNEC